MKYDKFANARYSRFAYLLGSVSFDGMAIDPLKYKSSSIHLNVGQFTFKTC